jgi:Uma2 family endonuclease
MATTLISLAEYLNTNYDPDLEYVDGELVERNVGKWDHGRLITLLGSWFFQHEEEWGIQTASDVRTRVSDTRVRLPDVLIVDQSAQPAVIEAPPVLCIEILSEGDTVAATKRKCEEYRAMGSQGIWIIDLMNRTGLCWADGGWREVSRLEVPETPIYLEMAYLWERLDARRPNSKETGQVRHGE